MSGDVNETKHCIWIVEKQHLESNASESSRQFRFNGRFELNFWLIFTRGKSFDEFHAWSSSSTLRNRTLTRRCRSAKLSKIFCLFITSRTHVFIICIRFIAQRDKRQVDDGNRAATYIGSWSSFDWGSLNFFRIIFVFGLFRRVGWHNATSIYISLSKVRPDGCWAEIVSHKKHRWGRKLMKFMMPCAQVLKRLNYTKTLLDCIQYFQRIYQPTTLYFHNPSEYCYIICARRPISHSCICAEPAELIGRATR